MKCWSPPARAVWFNTLHLLVPIGISYYTFEAINYTVDVYRRQVRAGAEPGAFALLRPVLPAPACRAHRSRQGFLPQLRRSKRWSWARLQLGGEYFLLGMLKKWVVADQLAVYADPVFANPGSFRHSGELDGSAGLHHRGLLRVFRLFRHGPGHGPHAGL